MTSRPKKFRPPSIGSFQPPDPTDTFFHSLKKPNRTTLNLARIFIYITHTIQKSKGYCRKIFQKRHFNNSGFVIKKIIKSIQEVLYVFFLKAMKATKTSPRFETSEKRI